MKPLLHLPYETPSQNQNTIDVIELLNKHNWDKLNVSVR